MNWLRIELAAERSRCGRLVLADAEGKTLAGPFPVAARASDALAKAHGNPSRHPLFAYGDTPTGRYALKGILKSGGHTEFSANEHGAHGVVLLEPESGVAAEAEANGRFHFLIMGGALSKDGRLRSTAGGLRLKNEDLKQLIAALKILDSVACEIAERAGSGRGASVARETVFIDEALVCADPVRLPASPGSNPLAPRPQKREHGKRDAVFGSASALAFGMTVSFMALPSLALANAPTPQVTASQPARRDADKGARTVSTQGYVRLAYGGSGGGNVSREPAGGYSFHATPGGAHCIHDLGTLPVSYYRERTWENDCATRIEVTFTVQSASGKTFELTYGVPAAKEDGTPGRMGYPLTSKDEDVIEWHEKF